ncbi:uncharacterized protein BDV14DRAFT_210412 [Aspergillus stella-maris]|uniref:uncharacterized protein n=1 Tax=Aspergillus stella-maris TaxID=1810926 RepID=UPI003CCD0D2E
MASAAAGSNWGAQGSQASQGSGKAYDDGMYRGVGATDGAADTTGSAGTSDSSTAGTAAAGSSESTAADTTGSQSATSASKLHGEAGSTAQEATANQAPSEVQAQGTWQDTSSGQSLNSGATEAQTNGQSQGNTQGEANAQGQTWAQGETTQGQANAQQPAAQNSHSNTNANALSSGSQGTTQQPSSGGYDDGMWHGDNNGQTTTGQSQSNTQGNTNALNQDSTNSGQWSQKSNGQWQPSQQWQSPTDASTETSSTTTFATASPSSTSSDHPVHEPSALPDSTSESRRLSPGSEAGIAIGVMALVLLLLGLIFYRLHRKKRALQEQMRKEKNLPPLDKHNRMYSIASNLYTKSSLTLVGISEAFKGSTNNSAESIPNEANTTIHNENRRSITNGPAAANESTSTVNSTITQLPPPVLFTGDMHPALRKPTLKARAQRVAGHVVAPVTATASYAADKVRGMKKDKLSPAQRRSLQAHEYGFSEEFLHIPPPPEPTRRLPRVLTKVHASGSLTVRNLTQKLNRSQTSLGRSQSPSQSELPQFQTQVQPQTPIQPPPPAQLQHQCVCQCQAQHQPQSQEKAEAEAEPVKKPQPQTQSVATANNQMSSWSTMTSIHSLVKASEENQEQETRFPLPCEIIGEELFRVRSVSCGTVAMKNPAANISVDALAGRISEDEQAEQAAQAEQPQQPQQPEPQPESKPQPQPQPQPEPQPQGQAQPQQPQSRSQSRSPSPTTTSPLTQPTPVYQPPQVEVTSFKPSTITVYRIDMPFRPRSTGQLEVTEGMLVRLDQAFDDGWALCTVTDTEKRGLIPRACLSTWPQKDSRSYAPSIADPHLRNASSASLPISPVDSVAQSFRFYRQQSRSGTPGISPALSTISRS